MKPDLSTISPELGCTFQIPRWRNRAQIKALDKRFSSLQAYRGLKGRTLYFSFDSTAERDSFLAELSAMIEKRGNQTEAIKTTI